MKIVSDSALPPLSNYELVSTRYTLGNDMKFGCTLQADGNESLEYDRDVDFEVCLLV